LREAVVEKEVHEAREKVRLELAQQLAGVPTTEAGTGFPPIVYDENGRPRPAPMAYDSSYSDVPDHGHDLDGADDADDADVITFPGLDPPRG
jgi:hypothetical protein